MGFSLIGYLHFKSETWQTQEHLSSAGHSHAVIRVWLPLSYSLSRGGGAA